LFHLLHSYAKISFKNKLIARYGPVLYTIKVQGKNACPGGFFLFYGQQGCSFCLREGQKFYVIGIEEVYFAYNNKKMGDRRGAD
jgi:hypothetical protein